MDQQAIGRFISCCRNEKGLTQAQLAEMLGVSDKSISRWENGKTMPDISLYEPLCNALDVKISELLYARRMTDDERIKQGENSAFIVFKTKSQLESFGIFTEILIFVGIIIAVSFTKIFAENVLQIIIILLAGCFVWGFGIALRIKIRKAILQLGKNNN